MIWCVGMLFSEFPSFFHRESEKTDNSKKLFTVIRNCFVIFIVYSKTSLRHSSLIREFFSVLNTYRFLNI